jgi:hypothetical protein
MGIEFPVPESKKSKYTKDALSHLELARMFSYPKAPANDIVHYNAITPSK